MKKDLVLTMGEDLAMCCDIPKHVNPPAREAHHIPITAESEIEPNNKSQACRCDRWGHPCPACTDQNHEQRTPVQDFDSKEQR